jgi:hypothetical protein
VQRPAGRATMVWRVDEVRAAREGVTDDVP